MAVSNVLFLVWSIAQTHTSGYEAIFSVWSGHIKLPRNFPSRRSTAADLQASVFCFYPCQAEFDPEQTPPLILNASSASKGTEVGREFRIKSAASKAKSPTMYKQPDSKQSREPGISHCQRRRLSWISLQSLQSSEVIQDCVLLSNLPKGNYRICRWATEKFPCVPAEYAPVTT